MRSRDAALNGYNSIFLIDGVAPATMSRLPSALERMLRRSVGAILRRRAMETGRPRGREAASSSVRLLSPDLSEEDLVAQVHQAGYSGLAATMTLSGTRVVLMIRHDVVDGSGAVALIHALFDLACDRQPPEPGERAQPFPLARAVWKAGWRGLRAWASWRAEHVVPPPLAPTPTPAQLQRSTGRLFTRSVDAAAVSNLRSLQAGPRSTPTARIVCFALEQLAACHLDDVEWPVHVAVDLRHLVAPGRIDGNFFVAVPIGGLRSTDWSPATFSADILRVASGPAVFGLALSVKRRLVLAGRRLTRNPRFVGGYQVVATSLQSPRPFPEEAWVTGRPTRIAYVSTGPWWPASTMLQTWTVSNTTYLSVWDETERFDLGAFGERLSAVLDRKP